jgi:Flp pilus assembly protein TadD
VLQDALAHHRAGRLREAEALYRKVLAREPANADALHLLGVALHQFGRHEEAVDFISRAIAADGAQPEFHNNLGRVLLAQERFEPASQSYGRAAALDPGNAGVLVNLAFALIEQGRMQEAEQRSLQAIALRPDEAEAHQFLAVSLAGQERLDEAAESYRRAIALKPDYLAAHLNLAQLHLLRGDYDQGWTEYAWRWRRSDMPRPPASAGRLWTGAEDLRGKSILLQYEQGLGDTIHFIRYARQVATKGAKVFLDVPDVLKPHVRELGEVGSPPRTDYYCPLLSLPAAFRTTLRDIPAAVPYLRADPGDWRAKLAGGKQKLVGLCWRGNPAYKGDRHRSMSLKALEPLLALPGIRFISLQKELHPHEQSPHLVHPGGDFDSTASLVAALDLVISVDTVWAHWAGAIGKPFWLLLPRSTHWCWLLDREDSPWYPTAKLFRQKTAGDWAPVVRAVALELGRLS